MVLLAKRDDRSTLVVPHCREARRAATPGQRGESREVLAWVLLAEAEVSLGLLGSSPVAVTVRGQHKLLESGVRLVDCRETEQVPQQQRDEQPNFLAAVRLLAVLHLHRVQAQVRLTHAADGATGAQRMGSVCSLELHRATGVASGNRCPHSKQGVESQLVAGAVP